MWNRGKVPAVRYPAYVTCDAPANQPEERENKRPADILICHKCGYLRQMPKACPKCGSNQMRAYGLGSEKVETDVQALFPSARVLRWDWETTRQKDAHEIILGHFVAHRADILVGTQMLAKGLDLPLVTLVGIVLADVGLNLPDPFAAERTFNLLTQVAGPRRSFSPGGAGGAANLPAGTLRHSSRLPPRLCRFLSAGIGRASQVGLSAVQPAAAVGVPGFGPGQSQGRCACACEALINGHCHRCAVNYTDFIGPVPCFFAKVGGWYRWQIVVRGPDPPCW